MIRTGHGDGFIYLVGRNSRLLAWRYAELGVKVTIARATLTDGYIAWLG